MSFNVTGQPLTKYDKLTDDTLTTVFTAAKRTTILTMAFKETNGGTQTLNVYRDGSVTHSFRSTEAVTAKQRVLIDEVFVLNAGDTIEAQSGDASGHFDVMITYLAPEAAIGGDHH